MEVTWSRSIVTPHRSDVRILFLSQRFLLPMDTGGKIRTGKLLERLRDRVDVTLVSNVEPATDAPYLPQIDRLCARFVPVPWREPRRRTAGFYLRLLGQSLQSEPVSVQNDYSDALKRAVDMELATDRYDLAVCDFVQSASMFRDVRGLPTLLFQHNVESEIARRHVEQARGPVARVFWGLQWRRMGRFEAEACTRFDGVVAVSAHDATRMRDLYGLDNVDTIPTGVDTTYYQAAPDSTARPGEMVFCGSMDWLPNEDAMTFFLTDVLPRIRREVPDARVTIVGRRPSRTLDGLARRATGVTLTGWVDDTRPHVARGQVFIVPIRIGGGTRLKIYEGMAQGRAVVSTSVGAEGLEYEDGRNIVIADGAEAFASAVGSLLRDDQRRQGLAVAGREHVTRHFAWSRVADAFLSICDRTIGSSVA